MYSSNEHGPQGGGFQSYFPFLPVFLTKCDYFEDPLLIDTNIGVEVSSLESGLCMCV